ncbi:MAG TPA: Dabb family protein [Lachnospiraceae bacterium]|nr:Dabb family protein [Lachnospiraceae bacterium]
MVTHIVLWKINAELSTKERTTAGDTIKSNLEGLNGKIDGLISMEVIIDKLESSTHDIALISKFDSLDALNGYQKHPAHLEVVGYIRSVTYEAASFDY